MDVILGKHFIEIHVQTLIRFPGEKKREYRDNKRNDEKRSNTGVPNRAIVYHLPSLYSVLSTTLPGNIQYRLLYFHMDGKSNDNVTSYNILHNFRKEFPVILRDINVRLEWPIDQWPWSTNELELFCFVCRKKRENNWIVLKSWKFIVFHLHAHIYNCDMHSVLRHHQQQALINGFLVQTLILLGNSIINSKVPFDFRYYKTVSGLCSFVMCDAICLCRRECNCS